MRKPIIAGNWKMYKTPQETLAFLEAFLPLVKDHIRDEVRIFPSFTSLAAAIEAAAGSNIHIGAQTMHWLNEGAYTGETSPPMLLSLGCRHVLLGHSEQRQYFGETDERINLKLKSATAHGIYPIVCVGEVLSEREQNKTEEVLRTQVRAALKNIAPAEARHLVIAYEPVWCIGTGLTASPEMAADAHRIVRHELARCLDEQTAQNTRILYGGSVKPENISALMAQEEIDGALVGGASLAPSTFAGIVQYA
ncbi:MAG TPA: triose-phosphate isomerase [Acidobacteriaceae bacterium]|jgi:triosephosphate isomerase|nr:triose-phosphate isomerase [Acidobacteriaceae bacterium]